MTKQEITQLKRGDKLVIKIGKTTLYNYWFKAMYGDDIVLGTAPSLEYHIKAHYSLVHRA